MNLAFLIENAPPQFGTDRDDLGLEGEERLVYALKNPPPVGDAQKPELVELITRILGDTRSDRIRNAAAICLTDLIGRDAAKSIADVVRQPDMPRAAGSLLFALNDVEACLPLDLLVEVIARGSLEAQGEALTFLEDGRVETYTDGEFERAQKRLRDLSNAAASDTTRDAARIALEYMDDAISNADLS